MPPNKPRKTPKQARSQATVDAIVEAGAQLLVEYGYHESSTNKIAKRAGVSIGSVYQYFPNKDAIVLAVVERFSKNQFAILADALAEVANATVEDTVYRLIRAFLESKKTDLELSRVLFGELPQLDNNDLLRDWNQRAAVLIQVGLKTREDEVDLKNLELASFVLVTACHGIIQSAVVERPELLDDDALADEIARLVLRYLNPGRY